MKRKTIASDPRTAAQKQLDEAAAAGDWTGFETKELLTEQGSQQLLAQGRILRKAREQDPVATMGCVLNQPFRWKHKVFRLLRCDFVAGEAIVETAPTDDEFVAEVKHRVEANRFHHLDYCQGFGFACFPEDYQQYRD
jgi:hypothetical protein